MQKCLELGTTTLGPPAKLSERGLIAFPLALAKFEKTRSDSKYG